MSHYKPYAAYKSSGVEWLGDVPEHWEVKQIKYSFKVVGGSTPKSDQSDLWDGNHVWVTPSDLSKLNSLFINNSQRRISSKGLAYCAATLVPANTIILSTRAPIGSLAIAERELCTNQGCKSLVPAPNVEASFYAYLLSISSTELNIRGKGTTFLELSGDALASFPVTYPPTDEQRVIAAYLDSESNRIDGLVGKKTRFIELLREKRQALITHAVTKGLDPNVKMKDSGVEWLGQVPSGWNVTPLKYIGSAIIGLTYSPEDVVDEGEGTLVLRSSNIQHGRITLDDNGVVKAIIPHRLITRLGDILICSRNGSRSLIGKNGMIDSASEGLSFGAFTTVFRTKHYKFLYYVLNSSLFKFQAGRFLTTTINQLTTETLNSFEIPLPPSDEQDLITEHLDRETLRLDTIISKTERSIELLKERRSALITAAVTGQIDLREVA
jgi:type I restriction enzyme S subunit